MVGVTPPCYILAGVRFCLGLGFGLFVVVFTFLVVRLCFRLESLGFIRLIGWGVLLCRCGGLLVVGGRLRF